MSESEIPAIVPADVAAKLMVEHWAQHGFDVAASATAMIEAMLPYADFTPSQEIETGTQTPSQAAHSFSQLVLTPSPRPAPAIAPIFAKQVSCKLCGGTGCKACK